MNNPDATVAGALARAAARIGGDSPRLDAELLLGAIIQRDRTWFRTWPDYQLDAESLAAFDRQVEKRVAGHPVAHLLGRQGFWTLSLQVSEHTLIPRPDTESLVEAALALPLPGNARILDLGTGTGAIALALASERPGWQVTATDAVDDAVALARRNADALGLPVVVEKSHWFDQLAPSRFDLIVSNPPYIADQDEHLGQGDVRFEPASALVAGADGLDDIRLIVAGAEQWLTPAGWLLLEHGFDQGGAVRALFEAAGFRHVETRRDYGQNDRFTLGQKGSRKTPHHGDNPC